MKKRIENYDQVLHRRDGTLIHVVENVIGAFDEQGELNCSGKFVK